MTSALDQARERIVAGWLGLSLREKVLIGVVLGLAGAFAFQGLVWRPLETWRRASLTQIRTADTILARLSQAPAGSSQPGASASAPIRGTDDLTASAAEAGLAIQRLEPEGGGARVTFQDVEFAKLVGWLDRIAGDRPDRLATVRIERQGAPGKVNAEILVAGS
jgi:general secretion pathway protein M